MGRARWDFACSPPVTHNWWMSSVTFCEPFSNTDPPALTRGTHHSREPNLGLASPGARQCGELSIAQRPAGTQGIFGGFTLRIVIPAELYAFWCQAGYQETRPSCLHSRGEPRSGRGRLPQPGRGSRTAAPLGPGSPWAPATPGGPVLFPSLPARDAAPPPHPPPLPPPSSTAPPLPVSRESPAPLCHGRRGPGTLPERGR